ncbi:hypothetical protein [Lacticaseibacillus absianus]|uniref:hypothetical protein n=1 Tax=Lacticaseibacillus absianus TaxID=2729623 RepID=UPI0015CEADEA|nr:hypothetical protein [Lacticaseibacillus absianus]
MADGDLLWGQWQGLSAAQREFAAAQLSRYFLSPLLAVDAREPVRVTTFGQTFETYDFLIAGEWLRFVPGMGRVPLGVATPLPRPMHAVAQQMGLAPDAVGAALSPATTVDMPPMLVARTSIPSTLEMIGQVDLTTQQFRGNHFAYQPVRQAVLRLLTPTVASLDPAAAELAPVMATETLELRQVGATTYQVALRHPDWDRQALQKRLGGFGFALASEREYEYLMGGGQAELFPWGNRLPDAPMNFVPNRFGLTVPLRRPGSELIDAPVGKSLSLAGPPTGADWLSLSPFFRTAAPAFATTRYRKIVRIAL